ncbi:MAG: hypothetical protein JSV17_16505 [Candidatus Aminicenantes bacterium]|nr:MAG: hypothetical protein JSV17_16505 [Candidatus Aminicenantes bacterium]
MKKAYVLVVLLIPLCLFLGFRVFGVSGQQAQQAMGPSYGYESESIEMAEVGKLLERIGKEIQEKGQVTAGGESYALDGEGGLEWGVRKMRGGTIMQFQIVAGMESPRQANTLVAYAEGSQAGTPTELAEAVAKVGETLASDGAFVLEDYSVAFTGTATVEQRLTHAIRGRGNQPPYAFYFDVKYGETSFPTPQDEVDDVELEQRGWIKELAIKETTGVDQDAVVKMFESLSGDLKAGKVKVGDTALDVKENIQFGMTHLTTPDKKAHRIRVGVRFGETPPRKRPTGPRYNKEFFDEPMKKVGELMKRWGTEILEAGTFKLGENEFKIKELASYEVSASERGFSIELSYTESQKDK